MNFLQTWWFAALPPMELPIHIGSGDQAKGPSRHKRSRDFAAVIAQTSVAVGIFSILSTYSIK
jgi:hypothetical protein